MTRRLCAGILTWLVVGAAWASPQAGFTVPSWYRGQLATAATDRTLDDVRQLEADWVCLIVPTYVEDISSTWIDADSVKTPSDADLSHAVKAAHRRGLKVMLAIHISPRRGGWKGEIGRGFSSRDWEEFFTNYRALARRYASLASELDCEQFCLGNELGSTVQREAEWRRLIRETRQVYEGEITYAANHDEASKVNWWDAVDLIGIDAYYGLTRSDEPTVAELRRAWERRADELESVASRWGKRILFTEIGYRSVDGANRIPWAWGEDLQADVDTQEQADCYEALLSTLMDRSWFAGVFLWALSPGERGGADDDGYTPLGKPAADVIRRHFQASQTSQPVQAGVLGEGWREGSYRAEVTPSGARGPYGEGALLAELERGGALSLTRSSGQRADQVSLTIRSSGSVRLSLEIDGQPVELGRLARGRWKTFQVPVSDQAVSRLTITPSDAARLEVTHLRLVDLPAPLPGTAGATSEPSRRMNPLRFFEDLLRRLREGLSFW